MCRYSTSAGDTPGPWSIPRRGKRPRRPEASHLRAGYTSRATSDFRPVREAGADRRGVHGHVVHDGRPLAVGDGGGGDPVARLACAALRSAGPGHAGSAAAARDDALASGAGGEPLYLHLTLTS